MRGFWLTMESVIACIIIASFLIFLARYSAMGTHEYDASSVAYDVLKSLDDRGVLREYALKGDYSGLNSQIDISGYSHVVNICGTGGDCDGPSPDSTNIWAGSYFISGRGIYNPMEVRLYLWKR
ncbi:MAG: hypothetical protein DRO99_04265 [Candidatus Aenigmatarchaeota archaeon]|nr:MAG: hypothetical protein DRO99_04265 [Candidatus Aenigmarchaeota archaeon]